jgi:predicted porin
MKKNLLHPLCGATLAVMSIAAHAQSSVTLYGVLDTSIDFAHSGGKSTTRLDGSNAFPSLWGIQGAEDIGGGNKIIFRLESGINVNNGTTAQANKLFGREAWVGASGPYGRLQLGLNDTPQMFAFLKFLAGDLGHWDWGHATSNYFFFPATKTANSAYYVSPNFAGLSFSALYAFGANGDPTQPRTLGNTASVAVSYDRGPLSVELNYMSQVFTAAPSITAAAPTETGTHNLFGISYDFGAIKVDGLLVAHRGAGDVRISSVPTYAEPNNLYYEVSAQVPRVLNGTVMLSFGQYKLQGNSAGNSTTYAMRYDYRISKRTGLYGGVAYVENGKEASFTENTGQGPGIPVSAGHNQLSSVVGMVHAF